MFKDGAPALYRRVYAYDFVVFPTFSTFYISMSILSSRVSERV